MDTMDYSEYSFYNFDCVKELRELKETRDQTDIEVHNALVNCTHRQGIVCIGKIESINEHDVAIQLSITHDSKRMCKDGDTTLLHAFVCQNTRALKSYITRYLAGRVLVKNIFYDDIYIISRYELKKLMAYIGKSITFFH